MKYEIFESIDLLIFRRNQKTYSLYVLEEILWRMSTISLEPFIRKVIARGMEPSQTAKSFKGQSEYYVNILKLGCAKSYLTGMS